MEHRQYLITVRDFVFRWVNKEFLIFLFFLALSGVFWLMMTLNESYEKELEVALRLTDVPANVVLTDELPDTMRITVRDKGFMLLSYTTSHKMQPLTFSFKTFSNKHTGKGQIPYTELQKAIRQQLFSSTTLLSIKGEQATFMFNYGERKVVPVTLAGNLKPGPSYYLAKVKMSPEKVTIYAAHAKLDSTTSIATVPLSIENIQDTVIQEVMLQKQHGVKIVPEKVNIKIYPDVLTEESVEVPIRAINMPEGTVLRTFPKKIKVFFTTGASMVRKIKESPDEFIVTADYNDFGKRHTEKCRLTLQNKPNDVRLTRLEPAYVDYLLEERL